MRERFLSANGLRFRYLDWEGTGPDIVLVHPTGFVADIWAPLAERLSARFHAVALDCRGHGDSDKPADWEIVRLIEDLAAFIAAAGLERPVGIGHSAGATTIAGLEAARPGTFGAAVLMDPVLSYDAPTAPRTLDNDPLAALTLKRRAVWPSRAAIYDSYRSKPPFQTWDEAPLRRYIEHGFKDRPDGAVELKCSPESEAHMYLHGAHGLAAEDIMPRVGCPALVIRGENSEVLTQAVAERTVSLLPDARLLSMPGAHFAPFEHPRQAEEAVVRFLDEQSLTGSSTGGGRREPEAAG